MKAVVLVLLVGSALAAPTDDLKTDIIESARSKKSAYGPPPCAGGAGMAPVALYLSAQPAGMMGSGSEQHYRENEETKEKERSYYDAAAGIGAASAAGALSAGGAAGGAGASLGSGSGAIGVFPSANVGGCAIPLLLSCAPNVVSGQLAHAPHHAPQNPAYRASENTQKHDLMREKALDAQHAASEKQAAMEDPELESQTLFHHSRPMGFMHPHQHGMMGHHNLHHFGQGFGQF